MTDIEVARAFFLLGFVLGGFVFTAITVGLFLLIYNRKLTRLLYDIQDRLDELEIEE